MIVIYRNGKRTVITGWRAWLLAGPAMLLVAVGIIALACLLLGIALTLAVVVTFGVPLAILLGFLLQLLQGKR